MRYEDMTPEQRQEYGFFKIDPRITELIKRNREPKERSKTVLFRQSKEDRMQELEALRTIEATRKRRATKGRFTQ